MIEKSRDQLTELVTQLLNFRKMDARKHIMAPQKIDLKKFISSIYDNFVKTAKTKNIKMSVCLPENEAIVFSDMDALSKITDNLLSNALKFTRDYINLSLTSNQDNSFTISVSDNGIGIPDSQKYLIFDPFYQVEKKNQKSGYGIGLALVKNLSDILDGHTEVCNRADGGSVFSFTFSDLAVETDEKPIHDFEIEPNTDSRHSDANLPRILAVDDNNDMTAFLSSNLGGLYIVDTAENVSEAFKLLRTHSYKLIISDIMMPDIDGFSFTRRLKSDSELSHIPIILLSARTEVASKTEGLHSGADAYIEKPFSMQYLKAQIASLISNRENILESFKKSPLMPFSVLATNKNDEIFIKNLNDEIHKHLSDEHFTVESLADIFAVSRSSLQRKVKTISGMTPGDYLRSFRLKTACRLLLNTEKRINEIAFEVGFNSASYFTKAFIKMYDMTPSEFIESHKKTH